MLETALVFDTEGAVLLWHEPEGRTGAYLPDSDEFWNFLWENRGRLGGVAHSHPWSGDALPSHTDITTFAAIEAGLGRRLLWPIATFSEVAFLQWIGPHRLDYGIIEVHEGVDNIDIQGLLARSRRTS